jgi:hypothetical protein
VSTASQGEPADGLSALADYTKEQLAAEDRRKASFEQRGLAVVTTSGALVTLLFGLAALSTKSQSFVLEDAAKPPLVGALVLFVLAAIGALVTNFPVKYSWVDVEDVRAAAKRDPPPSEASAHQNIALTNLKVLKVANRKNQLKASR